jgi:hypothetical protein
MSFQCSLLLKQDSVPLYANGGLVDVHQLELAELETTTMKLEDEQQKSVAPPIVCVAKLMDVCIDI